MTFGIILTIGADLLLPVQISVIIGEVSCDLVERGIDRQTETETETGRE